MTLVSVPPIRGEIKAFLQLAIPLVSAQIAQSATGFVDTVMMGHLGWKALAAGGLASFTFQVFLNVLSGVVMGASPLVAEAYGAGRKTRIEQVTQQGLCLTIGLSILTMWIIAHLDTVMLRLGQSPETVTLASSYLNIMLWGLFPAVAFALFRGVVSGLAQTRPIMMIVMGGTLFNIAGNYVLGYGQFGFPRLELVGLALASALSWWGMFLALLIYLLKHPQLRIYNLFQNWYQPKFRLLSELATIGTPIGVSIAFEYGLVLVMTYLMGILGTDVLAAHQIALQTGMIAFMIPLGMSFAATARVGQWFGQQRLERTREAGYVSIAVALATTTLVAVALLIFRQQVVGLYIDINDPANAALLKLVTPMLAVVAIGHIFDGVQKTTLGALYGLQDTRTPVVLGVLSFAGIGLVSGYMLGFHFGFGGAGLWMGYYLGSITAAAVYLWRFGWLISRKSEEFN